MSAPSANAAKSNGPAKAAAKPAREKPPRMAKRSFSTSSFAGAESALQGGGLPLEPNLRARMERGFGYDFGNVRIHCGPAAEASAHALNARAYAVGRHVVFDRGEYRPDDAAGQHLIAHELAHVVQQGSSEYRADRPLEVQPGNSALEREADRAAAGVSRGDRADVRAAAGPGVQRLQRAEHGTYVSTLSKTGGPEYLDAGAAFYRTWGHPNVKRVSNTKQILDDLDTSKGMIERFRIVSHGDDTGIELGLLPEIGPAFFKVPEVSRHTSEGEFRKDFADATIVVESKAVEIYKALWKDKATQPLLAMLGGTKDIPGAATNFGILFRALVDERFMADVKLDTGKPAKITNAAAVKTYINLRRETYGRLIVAAKDKDKRAETQKGIAELRKLMPTAMASAKIVFGTLTESEAKTLADPLVEKGSLKKSLSKSIEEGAGGPFLKKLNSVRNKIDSKTHIEIRGCNVGSKKPTMDAIRAFFGKPGALPSLSAPDLFQYFYQLNVKSYSAREQADLEAVYDDAPVGVKASFDDLRRMKAGEMVRSAKGGTLKAVAQRYSFSVANAVKFNPELTGKDDERIAPGTVIWLLQRDTAPAGRHKSIKDFAEKYLGKPNAWQKLAKANPGLSDPQKLSASDQIKIPKDLLDPKFASMASMKSNFVAAVRGGEAVAGVASEIDVNVRTRRGVVKERKTLEPPRPVLHIDDDKRNQALGKWLAGQKFDPKGRTAQALGDGFGKSGAQFEKARKNTYVQFLSRDYPVPKEPIFPEDPRYDKHIRQSP